MIVQPTDSTSPWGVQRIRWQKLKNLLYHKISTFSMKFALTQVVGGAKVEVMNHVEVMNDFGAIAPRRIAAEQALLREGGIFSFALLARQRLQRAN